VPRLRARPGVGAGGRHRTGWHRAGLEIALRRVAAASAQKLLLCGAFHAFGDNPEIELVRLIDDRLHDGGVVRSRETSRTKARSILRRSIGSMFNEPQARVARPEVIDR
jgi:hypothetical protein